MEKDTFDILTQERAVSPQTGPPSTEQDDAAALSSELFREFKSDSQNWRDQLVEDWDFFLGAQSSSNQDDTKKKRKQKSFNVDVIFQAVEQAIALLTSNRPGFTATGEEDSDTRIAGVYAAIMQHLWYANRATQKLKQTIKDYYVGSVGWFYVYWNPLAANGKGEICMETCDPKRVYVSPHAKDFFWQDSEHIIYESYLTSEMMQQTYNMTLEEVVGFQASSEETITSTRVSEMYSGSANNSSNLGGRQVYQRLDRFSKVKVPMYILEKENERFEMLVAPEQFVQRTKQTTCIVSRSARGTITFVAPRNVSNVAQLLSQYGEVFHEVQAAAVDGQQPSTQLMSGIEGQVDYPPGVTPVPNSTTYLKLITLYDAVKNGEVKARKLLVDRIKHVASIGTRLLFEAVQPTEYHVMVPLINNFDRTPWPIGDVRRVKREQEFINSVRQLIVTHAAKATNFKIGYPEGRYDEKKLTEIFNDPSKPFIPYDTELQSTGLQVIAPPSLSNHLYALEQQARKNIEERLGIFALMQGSPTDAPNTYKGTVALDEYAQRRIKSKKDDIEEFLNQIGKIVVDFVQYYYTDNRVINIVQPNDKPMTITLRNDSTFDNLYEGNEFRINDIMVGRFDVRVVSGSMLPSNRWALAEMYKEFYKEGLIDQETVLRKTEIANVDQVMERIGIANQLKRALQEAQDRIKMLEGDKQTSDRELMHAKRDRDMTVFQKNLESEEIKAAAARMIYETTLKMMKGSVGGSSKSEGSSRQSMPRINIDVAAPVVNVAPAAVTVNNTMPDNKGKITINRDKDGNAKSLEKT